MSELDALDPLTEPVKLSTGTLVAIRPMRSREFFKLLRILTRGALPVLNDMSLFTVDEDTDAREYVGRLLTVLFLAIPEAENETIDFVGAMCEPVGLIEGRKLNKLDTERNNTLWKQVITDLDNPTLDDLVTIIEAIVRREADDIQALGKRLTAMLRLARKTGQIPTSPSPTSPVPSFSADSPEPTTYSATSTDGLTMSFPDSPSSSYASGSPPSGNDASTPSGTETSG